MQPDSKLKNVVVVVDTSDKTYCSHRIFETLSEAFAYEEGMEDAWKISHGTYNCWCPYALGSPPQFEEWQEIGSPGKDIVEKAIGERFDE